VASEGGEYLERHEPRRVRAPRAIDRAHAALAELRYDLVAGDEPGLAGLHGRGVPELLRLVGGEPLLADEHGLELLVDAHLVAHLALDFEGLVELLLREVPPLDGELAEDCVLPARHGTHLPRRSDAGPGRMLSPLGYLSR